MWERGTNKIDTIIIGAGAYLLISFIVFFGIILLEVIIPGTKSAVTDTWGSLCLGNLICFGPFALFIMLGLGAVKLKDSMDRKKEIVKAGIAAPESGHDTARKESITEAETGLDVWTLIIQLKAVDSADRIEAIRGLRSHCTRDVEDELTKAVLEDPDVSVRYEAYLALKFQGKDKIALLIDQLKSAGSTNVKLSLLELLRKTGDASQIDTLVYLYDFETDKSVRLSILESLNKLYSPKVRDLAISVIRKDDDKDVRMRALKVICNYEDSYTQDILRRLSDDPDADIRNESEKALKAIDIQAE